MSIQFKSVKFIAIYNVNIPTINVQTIYVIYIFIAEQTQKVCKTMAIKYKNRGVY